MQEAVEYRYISGFPGYRITSVGGVESQNRSSGFLSDDWRPLKPWKNTRGYYSVNLCHCGQCYTRMVHRLICEAFHGPCPEGMECCHGDGDKTNNRKGNLRWDTHVANMQDAVAHGSMRGAPINSGNWRTRPPIGESNGNSKLTAVLVVEIRSLHASGVSIRNLADHFRVTEKNIAYVVSRRTWAHVA